ncbi:MAG: tetratricopeptide repeat protein [Planctomycetes bacterium]|nr:tetratricopeptide repeat protein [Planctomycetota bacterium]
MERALEACRTGDLDDAERRFRRLVRDHPRRIELHLSLAAILRDRDRHTEALDRLRRALALDPARLDVRLQIGALLFQLGRGDDAILAYQEVTARAPDLDEAHDVLAVALWHAGRLEEAGAEFARFTELRPESAQGHMNLGAVQHERGRIAEAVASYRRVLLLSPDHAPAHENLGKALARLHATGHAADAARLAKEWRRDFPANAWAQHLGASVSGEDPPERCSDAYLQAEFDGCADGFAPRLAALGYCAPQRLAEALARDLPPAAGGLDVLDLGCGPGTAAGHLRPHALRLVGLDLAPLMLDQARAAGAYDDLVLDELGAFLRAHPSGFDLIFAADVLCYSGRLDGLFAAVAGALRPAGTFGFTVQEERASDGFRLTVSGRYSHSTAYLRATVAAAGLTLLRLFAGPGRDEGADHLGFTYGVVRRLAQPLAQPLAGPAHPAHPAPPPPAAPVRGG